MCPEFTLFFSAALGCYLVLVCGAEVSLLSDVWTLFVCWYEVHIRAFRTDRHQAESVCVCVCEERWETEHTRKKLSSPVWRLVIKGSCNHSFCSSPPYFCCCLSSCCQLLCQHVWEHQITALAVTFLLCVYFQLFAFTQLCCRLESWDMSFYIKKS